MGAASVFNLTQPRLRSKFVSASGTLVAPSDKLFLLAWGGGGAGGGGGANNGTGGGGGRGAEPRFASIVTTVGATLTFVIGTGGVRGAAQSNGVGSSSVAPSGGAGVDTTVTDGTFFSTFPGAVGGLGGVSASSTLNGDPTTRRPGSYPLGGFGATPNTVDATTGQASSYAIGGIAGPASANGNGGGGGGGAGFQQGGPGATGPLNNGNGTDGASTNTSYGAGGGGGAPGNNSVTNGGRGQPGGPGGCFVYWWE